MINVQKEVQAMANMAEARGLKVELIGSDNDQPHTCMLTKTLYLPRPLPSWPHHRIMRWRGEAWHEVGHHHPSQEKLNELMDEYEIGYDSPLGFAINAIDDVWQEMITATEYSGAGRMLSFSQGEAIGLSIDNVRSAGKEHFPEWMVDSMMLAYDARCLWQSEVNDRYDELVKLVGANKFPGLVDRVNTAINHSNPAQEVIDIAKEIIKANGIDPESPEGKGEPQKSDDDGEGEAGQGTGEAGDEDGNGVKSGKSDSDGEPESIELRAKYEDLMGHSHGKPVDPDIESKFKIDYDHARGEYLPYTMDTFKTSPPEVGNAWGRIVSTTQSLYEDTSGVSGRIARLFQTAAQTGREFQQKRGKLTAKHLTRGAMGDPRVFNRKIDRIDNKAEIVFLCDCSGSMSGSKFRSTIVSTGALSNALSIANVPHKVVGFTEDWDGPQNRVIKDWEESFVWDTFRDRFCAMDLSQNADGDHLMYEYNLLLQRDSKRKIIIVLSDGMPCCSNPGDAYTYLKLVTKEIQSKGLVELYGIGIMTDAVESYYHDHVVLDSPDHIEECLTNVVRNKIIKE